MGWSEALCPAGPCQVIPTPDKGSLTPSQRTLGQPRAGPVFVGARVTAAARCAALYSMSEAVRPVPPRAGLQSTRGPVARWSCEVVLVGAGGHSVPCALRAEVA